VRITPGRATRRDRQGPSDAEIERGLRERVGGVDLDSMSERELERLHAGLELRALVASLLAGDGLASSS
jgi:hypothetical protein